MSAPAPFSPVVTLLTMARAWESAVNDALKPLGLTTRKYGLLAHIRSAPGISFSELARRSSITVQSAHTTVAGFVDAGLVDDDTAHAGVASTLQITDRGTTLLSRTATAVAALDADFSSQHPELTEALRTYMNRAMTDLR